MLVNAADELVRMDVSFKMTHGLNGVYPQPVVNFKADGQNIYAIIDTGTPYFFLVWKQWYEGSHQSCNELIFGCYECVSPCKQGPTKIFTFVGDREVWLFPHTGKLDLKGKVSASLDFGLVSGYNRNPGMIWASLCLKQSHPDSPYKSIVEQLFTKKIIASNSFSIYFTGGDNPSGQLILGGDDPSKHAGPLSYV
ncbi:hypothetical protein FOL47_000190 [Perkinsus chesapeaki]|uniref:Peptidase A1 domain-containing protein n=1 Tax=Perkinsus chesapeaki TaxID=330153 RepID=A0A7J6MP09_PERCH|nr:hypothetical protein FOL47_000190 [Perkinsus chesapeaki]